MSAEEKRNRMRLLRQIVKEHNVQRWIRSFLQAMPAADAAGSKRGASLDSGFQYTFKSRRDETMPGVALVATAPTPRSSALRDWQRRKAARNRPGRRRRLSLL